MFKLICVTNRLLCSEDFFSRIKKIAAASPAAIILREKDLSEIEYEEMARETLNICAKFNTQLILHNFYETSVKLNAKALHLPLSKLQELSLSEKKQFEILGASCHSLDDAKVAESLGCTYITAGHIFDTECKKGLPGRGLNFLKNICENVSIPVYAIGGITPENARETQTAGANGCCVMSGFMQCDDVKSYVAALSS